MFVRWVCSDCCAVWVTGRDVCITIVPPIEGLVLGVSELGGVIVCGLTGGGVS